MVDFGYAEKIKPGEVVQSQHLKGSPLWMAPEVMSLGQYNQQVRGCYVRVFSMCMYDCVSVVRRVVMSPRSFEYCLRLTFCVFVCGLVCMWMAPKVMSLGPAQSVGESDIVRIALALAPLLCVCK